MTQAKGAFEGQLALVTGASRGIGAATALELAGRGAHVVLTARDSAALEQVEDEIHTTGGSATIAPFDLAEPDAVARLATALAGRWPALDMLVINAAVLPQLSSVQDIDPREFSRAMTVNVLATQTLLAAFHPQLKQSANPRIVGLTSSVGADARPFWGAYGSTKAAFDMLLDCYAQENGRVTDIRVAIVDPAATRTRMRARAYPGEDPNSVKPPQQVAVQIADLLASDFANNHRMRVD
ncbi:SDR family NAD(P)-dependent oxidoreductase [Croceicoccus sp. F390]|uniref:SDR family NAD(P)-dependent oxidoreductase n=1 Tax=Croceicoccus esteveae TaxID=3075597 RepID=A0ABU2ZEV0_9SPHN|nr:SDR family NAD(P)-dependent oxidoreductase [Croceicoccus sp. F390]MDT0574891.1 SDR family NAD(P)-dependent oxidoreductase [Croceicoccus sp. F390]